MRPEIDNVAPPKFPHLKANLKKRQMDEERQAAPPMPLSPIVELIFPCELRQIHLDRARQLPYTGPDHQSAAVAAERRHQGAAAQAEEHAGETWPCAVCCDIISLRAGGRPEKRVAEDFCG